MFNQIKVNPALVLITKTSWNFSSNLLTVFCLNIVLYSYFASKQGYFLKPSISYCIDLICDCSQYLAILIDSKGFILKSRINSKLICQRNEFKSFPRSTIKGLK